MKILFVTQYYPPETTPGGNRASELAERWARAGHDVTVVTAFPNHPSGAIPSEYRHKLSLLEWRNGVKVARSYIAAAPNRGVLRRAVAHVSWMVSAVLNGYRVGRACDVVLATSPPILCGLSGMLIAKLRRASFVFDVRDLWPDSIVAVGALREGVVVKVLRKLERRLYAAATRVVSVSPAFEDHIRAIAPTPILTIPNGADLDRFRPGLASADLYAGHRIHQQVRLLYAGAIGMAHGLEFMVRAAERLRDQRDLAVVIVGDGAERESLQKHAAELRLSNIYFVGPRPRCEMVDWIRGAAATIVHLKPTPLFDLVLPSKLLEYMACGRPVLNGVGGLTQRLVAEAGAGWQYDSRDVETFVQAVSELMLDRPMRERKGQCGRLYVEEHFDRDKLAEQYLEEILTIVRG